MIACFWVNNCVHLFVSKLNLLFRININTWWPQVTPWPGFRIFSLNVALLHEPLHWSTSASFVARCCSPWAQDSESNEVLDSVLWVTSNSGHSMILILQSHFILCSEQGGLIMAPVQKPFVYHICGGASGSCVFAVWRIKALVCNCVNYTICTERMSLSNENLCNITCRSHLSKNSWSGPALGMFKSIDTPKPVTNCVLECTSPKKTSWEKIHSHLLNLYD